MHPNVQRFVKLAVEDAIGVVFFNNALSSRVSFKGSDDAQLAVTLEVSREDEQVIVRLSGTVGGAALTPADVSGPAFESLVADAFLMVPEAVLTQGRVDAELSGEPLPGQTLNPAVGNSDEGRIHQVVSLSAQSTTPGDVSAFIASAVAQALNHVAADPNHEARICVQGSKKQWPTWVLIDRIHSEEKGTRYFARTNDMDLMVGYPPSLQVAADTIQELQPQIEQYLLGDQSGQESVSIKLFREVIVNRTIQATILVGDSTSGELREQAEFPSL